MIKRKTIRKLTVVLCILCCVFSSLSVPVLAKAASGTLTEQSSTTEIGVYVKTERDIANEYTVEVKNKKAELTVDGNITLKVSKIPSDAVTLAAYYIPQTETESWSWFENCLAGKKVSAKPLHIMDVYFLNASGSRINANGAEITISCKHCDSIPMICSVNTDGNAAVLWSASGSKGQAAFTTNGSHYYVIAQKVDSDNGDNGNDNTPGDNDNNNGNDNKPGDSDNNNGNDNKPADNDNNNGNNNKPGDSDNNNGNDNKPADNDNNNGNNNKPGDNDNNNGNNNKPGDNDNNNGNNNKPADNDNNNGNNNKPGDNNNNNGNGSGNNQPNHQPNGGNKPSNNKPNHQPNGGNKPSNNKPDGSGNPYIAGKSEINGWDSIKDQLEAAEEKEYVTVEMNGTTVVLGKVLESIKGKDVSVVFEMGEGVKWTVNGKGISTDTVSDIDFGVLIGEQAGSNIPINIVNNVTGERYSMNLTLSYNGEFGFTATLTLNMNKENAGLFANLFYYNPESGALEYICASQIDEDGNANLEFTHASDYVVVVDAEDMKEKDTDSAEDIPAVPETENGEVSADTEEITEGNFWWFIIIGVVVVIAGFGIFFVAKKKK